MNDDQTASSSIYESRDEAFKDAKSTWQYWMNALELAGKQEKAWRDSAKKATEIYNAKTKSAFNILYANTETVRAAIYNSAPIPDIRTRFGDRNEAARQGGVVLDRGLRYCADEYDFDHVLKSCVHNASLQGRGVGWVRYEPIMRTVAMEDEQGKPQSREEIAWQQAICDRVPWDKFRHGPADTWSLVPWVARHKGMTRDDLRQVPGIKPAVADAVPLDLSDGDLGDDKSEREKSTFKRAGVWEIWDKATRQVFLVAPGYPDGPIAIIDDPLNLLDFFPVPRPLMAVMEAETLVPVVPYDLYKAQADELAEVSRRIIALTKILKFRGIRAAEVPEIDQAMQLDDGDFAASTGALQVLGQDKTLDDAIWVMPIDKIIITVRELVAQREQIKQAIYEITGMADIMRGASNPNETLGAQQIKAQWGSVRVSDLQRDVQRFARDILRLKAEIIAGKFTAQTLAYINGGDVPPQVMALLRNDVQRTYTIDIETDSTIRGDLARAQQNMTMFLQGTAQFAQSIGPLVASSVNPNGVIPPQLALAVYGSFARQFKLGKEVEDLLNRFLDEASQNPPGQPTPQQQQEQQDAKAIQRAGAVAEVQRKQSEADQAAAKAKGQQIENVVAVHEAVNGQRPQGFVQ